MKIVVHTFKQKTCIQTNIEYYVWFKLQIADACNSDAECNSICKFKRERERASYKSD